ncbi:MAG: PH domain-containing protein [Alphaproteobacteria bacterium]|nr:PH domain-containing protein [Alphaproteobacteria bacterium]
MGSYVSSNLIAGEEVIYETGPHPIIYLSPAALIVGGIVLGTVANPSIGAVLLGFGVLSLVGAWLRQWAGEFAVTNRRVIVKLGLIYRHTIEINLSKVESVEVNQDIFGRLFNYGTITVIRTGGTHEPFALINDPLAFRRAVQSQKP